MLTVSALLSAYILLINHFNLCTIPSIMSLSFPTGGMNNIITSVGTPYINTDLIIPTLSSFSKEPALSTAGLQPHGERADHRVAALHHL
jgi:hypothetical protein